MDTTSQDSAIASLVARHETADPIHVTRRLRIPPDETLVAGEQSFTWASGGTIVQREPPKQSLWSIETSGRVIGAAVETHVRWLLTLVERNPAEVGILLDSGWSLEIFASAFGDSHLGQVSAGVRERLERIGVSLVVYASADGDSSDDEPECWDSSIDGLLQDAVAERNSEILRDLKTRFEQGGLHFPSARTLDELPGVLVEVLRAGGIGVACDALAELMRLDFDVLCGGWSPESMVRAIFMVVSVGEVEPSFLRRVSEYLELHSHRWGHPSNTGFSFDGVWARMHMLAWLAAVPGVWTAGSVESVFRFQRDEH